MLLNWDDVECRCPYQSSSRSTFYVNATAWSRGLDVTGGGTGVVSHAGLVLLRQLADRTGLTAGLSGGRPRPGGGAGAGTATGGRVPAAVTAARRQAWSRGVPRHGQLPPVQVADRQLAGITCIR